MAVTDGFLFITQLLLGKAETLQQALYRFGIWAILFTLFFNGASRIFKNKNANIILSFILSALAARAIPIYILLLFGNVILIVALLVIPYKIVDRFTKNMKILKIALLLVFYLLLFILISGISPDIGLLNWLYLVGKHYYTAYSIELTILSALLVIYLAYHYTKKA